MTISCASISLTFLSQVFIQGLVNLNRAVHEDIVAVEILPKSQWTCPSSVITTASLTEDVDDGDDDDDNNDSSDGNDLKVHVHVCYAFFLPVFF